MSAKKLNTEIIKKSVNKMVTDKELVRFYIRGKISLEKLKEHGVKLAKPL